jgi:hypothetical protein
VIGSLTAMRDDPRLLAGRAQAGLAELAGRAQAGLAELAGHAGAPITRSSPGDGRQDGRPDRRGWALARSHFDGAA